MISFADVKKDNFKDTKNDIISIRKVGKFIIGKEEKRTKKDNIVLSIKKYN